ncbi:adhesin [Yersinia mollaretii]|uniref:contact-dependent inhibition toxin CdiA n=1 Tax=Yersinia mollaretii TaxID=33060 RepID=UPI0005E92775|nr:adhesin [Yersinia mollaretii]
MIPIYFRQKLISYALIYLVAIQPIMPVMAAGIDVAQGSTALDKAGNGVPVVNIAPPNSSGVSHNVYNQFNVGTEGVILNNATDRLTQTQLGGLIQSNANLNGKAAGAIINEVVSANRSQLNGYLEVGGKAAAVMVANPYGITCDGCGFINTPNVTLTTGKPMMDTNGKLQSLDVTQGVISIQGKGLDASQSSALSLISRANEINAQIHAQDLTVIAGSNRVDSAGHVSERQGQGDVPQVSIDTGALGGMYANRIRLVSSEKGVGVNLGNLNARQGDIHLDSKGKLTVNNAMAHGDIIASADQLHLQGNQRAQGNITLNSHGESLLGNATLLAGGTLAVKAGGKITSKESQLNAGVDSAGNIGEKGTVSLQGSELALQQSHVAAAAVSAVTSGYIAQDKDSSLTARQLKLSGQHLELAGQLAANNDLYITGQSLRGSKTASVGSQKNITFNLAGDSEWAGQMVAGNDLIFSGQSLANHGQLLAANQMQFEGLGLDNQGQILAADINIAANRLNNQGQLQGDNSVLLTADSLVQSTRGTMNSGRALTLRAAEMDISGDLQSQILDVKGNNWHNHGNVVAQEHAQLRLGNTIDNRGVLVSAGDMDLSFNQLSNQGRILGAELALSGENISNSGQLVGKQQLSLQLDEGYQGTDSGELKSDGLLSVTADDINNQGNWESGSLNTAAQQFTNNGKVLSVGSQNINLSGSLTNQQLGQFLTDGEFIIVAKQVINSGLLQGNQAVTLNGLKQYQGGSGSQLLTKGAGEIHSDNVNNAGLIQAGSLSLTGEVLDNTGTLSGLSALHIDSHNEIINQARGQLLSDNTIKLDSKQLVNNGLMQGTELTLASQHLTNNGTLLGLTYLELQAVNLTNNSAGKILSGQDLHFTTSHLQQNGQWTALRDLTGEIKGALDFSGAMAAGKQLSLQVDGDFNQRGNLQGNDVSITSRGVITNSGQLAAGSGSLALNGAAINQEQNGSLQSGGQISLTSRGDINNRGFVGAAGDLLLQAIGAVNNTSLLYAGGSMRLFADAIYNVRGDILAGNHLWMQRDSAGNSNREIINSSGNIETQHGDMVLNTASLLNRRDGFSVTEKTGAVNSGGIANVGATNILISSGYFKPGEVTHYSKTVTGGGHHGNVSTVNLLGLIPSARKQKLSTSSSIVTIDSPYDVGRIVAGRDLNISVNTLVNQASQMSAGRNALLQGQSLNNQSYQSGTLTQYLVYTNTRDTNPEYNLFEFKLSGSPTYEISNDGQLYQGVIQAVGSVSANFTQNLSNTSVKPNIGSIVHQVTQPSLTTTTVPSELATKPNSGAAQVAPDSNNGDLVALYNQSGTALTFGLGTDGKPLTRAQLSDYPLPDSNNGLFVVNSEPGSRYLISTNPTLEKLGNVDSTLLSGLQAMLGRQPQTSVAIERNPQWTQQDNFLGSDYLLKKINLDAEHDYRFLGDAAFDTRYINNAVLSQTGQRYLNGVGSDLSQMQYLLDNAAQSQKKLDLKLGVSLTPEQVAQLSHSIVWWENINVNGQTVLAPKLYLAKAEQAHLQGSVISGNKVELNAGSVINSGVLKGVELLAIASQDTITNEKGGLLTSEGALNLTALNNISNLSSSISGDRVAITSQNGDIINQTQTRQWSADQSRQPGYWSGIKTQSMTQTEVGETAAITAGKALTLAAGNNIAITGAKVTAAGDIGIQAAHDINIIANDLYRAQQQTLGRNRNIELNEKHDSQSSNVSAGGTLNAHAGRDITLSASHLGADGNATLQAERDVNLLVQEKSTRDQYIDSEDKTTGYTRSTLSSGGDLTASAGRDINSQAAAVAADNTLALNAGRDINLNAQQSSQYNESHGKNYKRVDEAIRQQGTELASGKDTQVHAGQDINLHAASISAKGDLGLQAGRDIAVNTATESDYHFFEEKKTKKKLVSKTTIHNVEEDFSTTEKSSALVGNNVSLSAGNNLIVKGSSVVGDGAVVLKADNNVDIVAATEQQSSYRLNEKKTSGMFSGGGLGVTLGSKSSRQQINQEGSKQSESASAVGSTAGNVSILAGAQAHISGSDVIAGKDLNVIAGTIKVDPGNDVLKRRQIYEQKQSGLTLSLSSPFTDALLAINSKLKQASDAGSDKLSALYGAQAAREAWVGVDGTMDMMAGKPGGPPADPGASIKLQLSVGASHSKSTSELAQNQTRGSSLTAGDNLTMIASGDHEQSGDLSVVGSGVTGNKVTLVAKNDVLLAAASNNSEQTSRDSSSGWNAGVHLSLGKETGIGIAANGFMSKGNSDGKTTDYANARINAKEALAINSGRDTVLSGAQVLGDKITAEIGRDLTISSLQDSDNYNSIQKDASAGFSFTFGPSGGGSASFSLGKTKIESKYASVGDQSGFFAGSKGFDLDVGNHTQLNGGVLASTAGAQDNLLSTGTLGWGDIHNQAEYKATSTRIGYSTDAPMPTLGMANAHGSASGTTRSAVASGEIEIRNQGEQQQDVTTLSRDTDSANGRIDKIFDESKVKDQMAFTQGVTQLATQLVGDVSSWNMKQAERSAAEKLEKDPKYQNATREKRQEMIYAFADYKAAQESFGIGSSFWTAGMAVSAALTGLAGNADIGSISSAAVAPYLAGQIKKYTTDKDDKVNKTINILAHAILGGVVAQMQGNSATAGALGGGGGELAARIYMDQVHPGKKVSDLSEADKKIVSAIGTLTAGILGGLSTDSSTGLITGAQAGKNAVENNALSVAQTQSLIKEMSQCQGGKVCEQSVIDKYREINAKQHQSVEQCQGTKACVDKAKEMSGIQVEYAAQIGKLEDKLHSTGVLSPEEWEEINYLKGVMPQLEADRMAAIRNAWSSGGSDEAKQLIINSLAQAGVAGASGIIGGHGKGGKPNGNVSKGNSSSFDANEIRFSQNTVSYNKTERGTGVKYTYDDLVSSMKKDGWKGDPIDVVRMPDGKMTSMDNTRISAAREAGVKVEANVRNFNDPLSQDMIDSGRFGTAKTWGDSITGRINNQSGGFGKNNPYGSIDSPKVTRKDKEK